MDFHTPHAAEPQLLRTRGLEERDGRALRRGYELGEQNRLRRGFYIPSQRWEEVDDDARYLMRIKSVMMSRKTEPVLSHASAARIWGLPVVGLWPVDVHLTVRGTTTRESKAGIIWHHDRITDAEVVSVDGMLVTSLLRTLVDIARSAQFIDAVVALDAGLRGPLHLPDGGPGHAVTAEQLTDAVYRLGSARGSRGARSAVKFADGRSGSAGESVSRVNIHVTGFPPPELQVPFRTSDGREDIVDFAWEARHTRQQMPLLGEFDGKVKYTRAQYAKGRTMEEIVWAEKVREDRLRAPGRGMVRWLWATAVNPDLLRVALLNAGLRPKL